MRSVRTGCGTRAIASADHTVTGLPWPGEHCGYQDASPIRSSDVAIHDTALGIANQDRGPVALPEIGAVGLWPLQSSLGLTAVPRDVPAARRHARQVLRSWGLHVAADDTELVVSELVSNAVAISAAIKHQDIRLWLVSDGRRILVLIWDASLDPPEIASPGADVDSGRGLLLVEALSTQWGWCFAAGLGGKVVWALISPHGALRKGNQRLAPPNQPIDVCISQPGSNPQGERMTITPEKTGSPRDLISAGLFEKLTFRVMSYDDGLDE